MKPKRTRKRVRNYDKLSSKKRNRKKSYSKKIKSKKQSSKKKMSLSQRGGACCGSRPKGKGSAKRAQVAATDAATDASRRLSPVSVGAAATDADAAAADADAASARTTNRVASPRTTSGRPLPAAGVAGGRQPNEYEFKYLSGTKGSGEYESYAQQQQDILNDAYAVYLQEGIPQVMITIHGDSYIVDFEAKRQIKRANTRLIRPIIIEKKQVRDTATLRSNYDKVIADASRYGAGLRDVSDGVYLNSIREEMTLIPRAAGDQADKELIILEGVFSQDLAFILTETFNQKGLEPPKLSIQVAGNALRPGGACGGYYGESVYIDKNGAENPDAKPPFHYGTQDESIMDSMIHGYKIDTLDKDPKTQDHENARPLYSDYFVKQIGLGAKLDGIYPPDALHHIKGLHGGNFGRPWGPMMGTEEVPLQLYPPHEWLAEQQGALSIQGHDFTEPFYCIDNVPVERGTPKLQERMKYHANKYNFAYTVSDIPIALSAKCYLHQRKGKGGNVRWHGGMDIVADESSITKGVDVVYVYGPNAFYSSYGDGGVRRRRSLLGTGTRSLIAGYREHRDYDVGPQSHHKKLNVTEYTDDYLIFKECVTMAFRATLTTMAMEGVDYPILCYVSGGIYGGFRGEGDPYTSATGTRIREDTPEIITQINEELGKPFKNIYLCAS